MIKLQHATEGQITRLSEADLDAIPLLDKLGEGSFGCVHRVAYKGRDAILKNIKENSGDPLHAFQWECSVMIELDGAAGCSPRLLAICESPLAVIQDYAGVPYYWYYFNEHVTVHMFLRTVVGVAESLTEIHNRGFVHNDIKNDNVTVTGPLHSP